MFQISLPTPVGPEAGAMYRDTLESALWTAVWGRAIGETKAGVSTDRWIAVVTLEIT